MFCKNCGRKIDQRTLTRLMEQKGEPVLCSKCRQPLDNAEICGGFWGLIAHSEGMEDANRIRNNPTVMVDEYGRPVRNIPPVRRRTIPGTTEADREWARMVLGGEYVSVNTRQTAGPAPSAVRAGGQQQTQFRGSGTRNDMELWITRGAALLLGIALIISLFFPRSTRPGKESGDPSSDTAVTDFLSGGGDADDADGGDDTGPGSSGKTSEEPQDGGEQKDADEPKEIEQPKDIVEPKDTVEPDTQGESKEEEGSLNKEELSNKEDLAETEETGNAVSGITENKEEVQPEGSGRPVRIQQ